MDTHKAESKLLDGMQLDQFKDIDFEDLQQTINSRSDVENGMDALSIYYPMSPNKNSGNKFTIKSLNKTLGNTYLIFKQENLNDDSLQAIAFWMEYEKSLFGKIKIIDFKQSFQCQEGRGHEEWGAELCN